jgi:two-component system, chemotaxis family, CheB/CheR fusion protein
MTSKNNKQPPSPDKPAGKQRKKKKTNGADPSQEKGLTIVGIGASAGGLKPLQTFFEALPPATGMAFVVVTHLHPEHESHMAEILQSKTPMRVSQVDRRVSIEPDHVYVIPPNHNIVVSDTYLEIEAFQTPRGTRTPIDGFFRSLAKAHRGSVAVILSGSGTDGAVGIKDVKEQGGVLLVQHPQEAEYDSMPNAAINTGLADMILPVRELVEKLVDYGSQAPRLPAEPEALSERELETIQRILAQVHARTGHDFSQYKRSTILRRIQRRMQLNGFEAPDEYLEYLRTNVGESVAMFNDILIGVTNFFRDREPWEALEKKVIPALFEQKAPGEKIRVWSIGCATGEEAYSLAILLLEQAERLHERFEIQVFASDLDEGALARARDGVYPTAIEADVSAERLEHFFIAQGNHYLVKRDLRDLVLFTNHSILRDPPFSHLDLVACRNVLIYLQREIQDNLFDIFHYSLNLGGYLFLGSSESAEQMPQLFEPVDKVNRIYQAKPWRGEHQHVPTLPLTIHRVPHPALRMIARPVYRQSVEGPATLEEQHKEAFEAYGPPSILVDDAYNILHLSETAGRYLLQPKGPITSELLKLVRPELQMELRSALFQAFEKDRAIVSKPVPVQFNGRPHLVVLSVRPRRPASNGVKGLQRQALVVFLEDELDERADGILGAPALAEGRDQARNNELIIQLESEVQRLREQLQASVEEFDSSNEEMKAANEELQSINEEYRSTTEELETSKEELQSVNEELQTVNNELKDKLEEISRAHSDLENLIASAEVATLFLDSELRIERYTPATAAIFNIMPSDRGRPISHLTHNLEYPELEREAREILGHPTPHEREVRGQTGEWYLVRMRPYRTMEDKIDGVVITIVDITPVKAAQEAQRQMAEDLERRVEQRTAEVEEANQNLSQARDLFHTLFHANPIPTSLTRLEDGLFMDVNDAYLEYYGLEYDHVIGRTSAELHVPHAPRVRPGLVARLLKEGMIRNLEMAIDFPSGETRNILASLQRINLDGTDAIISTFSDITERVRSEQQVRDVASSLTASEQVERHRISRVLHDDLQQNIFAVKMQLTFLSEAIENNDLQGLRLDLQQLDNWLEQAIATTRQLSIDLSPPVLNDEGLTEAVIWLASQMKEQYKLEVAVHTNGIHAAFEDDVRVLVFQSIRELLFNVVKHSGTLIAQVRFEQIGDKVFITVSDGGMGFDSQAVLEDWKTGHGLLRMRDRLLLLGCNLEVKSEPDNGTRITIEAPIKDTVD